MIQKEPSLNCILQNFELMVTSDFKIFSLVFFNKQSFHFSFTVLCSIDYNNYLGFEVWVPSFKKTYHNIFLLIYIYCLIYRTTTSFGNKFNYFSIRFNICFNPALFSLATTNKVSVDLLLSY